MADFIPILLFVLVSTGLALGMLFAGSLFGPRRKGAVKAMPYESGMDPFMIRAAALIFISI